MNRKWIGAVVIGLAAAGMHFVYLKQMEKKTTGGEAVSVLSLSSSVAAGEKITEGDLAARLIPVSYLDDRTVLADRADDIVDLVPVIDLKKGQLIQWTDFNERTGAESVDLAELLKSGKRAITIPVDSSLSMGGMLRPGHRVDIMGTFNHGESRFNKATVTLLQNVPVLAVGSHVQGARADEEIDGKRGKKAFGRSRKFNTVTLAVGLEEAELLALSTRQGSLSVALRGRQDLEIVSGVPEVTMKDVWERDLKVPEIKLPISPSKMIERIQTR